MSFVYTVAAATSPVVRSVVTGKSPMLPFSLICVHDTLEYHGGEEISRLSYCSLSDTKSFVAVIYTGCLEDESSGLYGDT